MAGKDEVKQKIDIVEYIGQFVSLKPAGRNFKGLCPFHKEKSPSFFVSPERQNFKCFGCGEGGDIFTFYEKIEGVSFFEALKDLADYAGLELTDFSPDQDYQQKNVLIEIHNLASKYYQYILTSHPVGKNGLDYLAKRQIPLSQAKEFQLGFSPNSWHSLSDFLLKKGFTKELLILSGLCLTSDRGGQPYDRFRGRLMFPLKDTRGNIVGFSGRILPEFDDGKTGKYINSPETPIYHKSQLLFPFSQTKNAIRDKKEVIVVEGEMDALASLRASIKNVVAVKGTAFTSDQVRLLSRYVDTIILSLDSDKAGVAAAKKSVAVIKDFELNIRVLEAKGGKDPDEIVREDPNLWREATQKTVDVYDFFLDSAFSQNDINTPVGQKAISSEIIPVLNQIQNQIIKAHFVKKFAQKLDLKIETVEKEMMRIGQKSSSPSTLFPDKIQTEKPKEKPLIDKLLAELLSLIIATYGKFNLKKIPVTDFPSSSVTQIITKLIKESPQDLNQFADNLPSHLQESFNYSFLLEVEKLNDKALDKRFDFLISRIAKITLRDKLSEIANKLKTISDDKLSDELKRQYNDILVRFSSYGK